MESNFVDYVKILCRSGKGGRGSMHLHRAKYQPNGGPDGGNGGRGGHIFLRGNHNYWTLLHLRYQRHIFAGNGGNGGDNCSTGAQGEDKYIDVPCGTVAYNAQTGEYLCDVVADGQTVLLLRGGRGGLGNKEFATATNKAPRYAQPGGPMQEMNVVLQLKLLADVGLVGFPNAGKSTLLSTLSSARPKIANYPFTTLEPSLGIVPYRDGKSFVMADIPGIIEGASEGRGIGLRFLRHIERNSLLLFLVECESDSIKDSYSVLVNEIRKFNPEILNKKRILAVTKCDLIDNDLINLLRQDLPPDVPTVFISASTGLGLDKLKDLIWEELNRESNKLASVSASADDSSVADYNNLVHKNLDVKALSADFAGWDEDDDDNVTDNNAKNEGKPSSKRSINVDEPDDDEIIYIE